MVGWLDGWIVGLDGWMVGLDGSGWVWMGLEGYMHSPDPPLLPPTVSDREPTGLSEPIL